MSAFVPEAEFRRIRESWRTAGRLPEKWNDRRCFEACFANLQEAAQRERDLRAVFSGLPPGDPRFQGDNDTPPLSMQILTAVLDQRHWREYVAHYRKRADAAQPARVLPREPGDDDEELAF